MSDQENRGWGAAFAALAHTKLSKSTDEERRDAGGLPDILLPQSPEKRRASKSKPPQQHRRITTCYSEILIDLPDEEES